MPRPLFAYLNRPLVCVDDTSCCGYGSYSSAEDRLLSLAPAATSTLPSGSNVAVCSVRGMAMLPACVNLPTDTTVMFTMVETVPALLLPVTEYDAMSIAEVDVPEVTPVAGSRFKPAGNGRRSAHG